MQIPMVNLKREYERLRGEIEPAVAIALAACEYIGGPNVKAFESEAARYAGVKHAIACASGTDALLVALRAAGIGPGDEVITTPFTFIATASTVAMCGAKPVFVDVDSRTFNIDVAKIRAAITPRTRAIVPVHMFGQPVDLAPVKELCSQNNLRLIEDAAQSFGADYGGRKSGAFGDIGCVSFYPSKNLGAFGDAGMMLTDDDTLAAEMRVLANHGSRTRYYHDVVGYNSRLDELQAVVLRVKLKRLDEFAEQRRAIARLYDELLRDIVEIPFADGAGTHVYHQYTILTDHRATVQKALNEVGIGSAIYYPVPLHMQQAFRTSHAAQSFPVAERTSQRCLSLPISPTLERAEVESVAACVRQALR